MTDLIWKPVAICALVGMLVVAVAGATGWYLAAREREAARTELVTERLKNEQLTAAVRAQNAAVDALASAKADAEARGQTALQLAAANGKRYDQALARTRAAQATTCTEAMPAVNDVLESIR